MSLTAEPAIVTVQATGGKSLHQLQNTGKTRLAFKVKSSNNKDYRLAPVFGFVDAEKAAKLEITRSAGPAKEDKLIVLFAEVDAAATDPKAAFEVGKQAGQLTLPISAKGEGEAAPAPVAADATQSDGAAPPAADATPAEPANL